MIRKAAGALLFWLALPLAAVWGLFVLNAGVLAVAFYALYMLLVFSRLMTLFWLRPLMIERELSADVISIGDPLSVVVKLTNASPLPILWLYAEETLPKKMPREGMTKRLLFIPPGRTFHLHYRITPLVRGCHQIGPVVMETGDVFGLFKRARVDPRRDFVTVLPAYQVLGEFQVGARRNLGDITAGRSIFEDPSRLRGVREYRRGDALKRIHWRSSARTGRLCTKIFDPVMEAGATVVLDFNEAAWAQAAAHGSDKAPPEIALELACTVCRYLGDGGWKVGLLTNGRDPLGLPGISIAQARATDTLREALAAARIGKADDRLEPISIRARRSADQFPLIHECLGRLRLSDGLEIEDVLAGELPHIEREQALVVVAGAASDGFVSGILRARELGYRIMVLFVHNDAAHDRAFAAFIPHGIEVYRMDAEWRLREIATGRKFI